MQEHGHKDLHCPERLGIQSTQKSQDEGALTPNQTTEGKGLGHRPF